MAEDEDSALLAPDEELARLGAIILEWQHLSNRRLDLSLEELGLAEEQRFWDLTAEGVRLFAGLVERTTARGKGTPLPIGVTDLLAHAAMGIEEAVAGDFPLAWRSKGKSKVRRVTRSERIARAYASTYFVLAEIDKLIPDKNPAATICELYGRKSSTPRSWRKDNHQLQYPVYLRLFAELSDPPEELPQLWLQKAKWLLGRAGRLYQRRVQ